MRTKMKVTRSSRKKVVTERALDEPNIEEMTNRESASAADEWPTARKAFDKRLLSLQIFIDEPRHLRNDRESASEANPNTMVRM